MKKIEKKIYQIDAAGEVLGRLATKIAMILSGKNRADYSPHAGGVDEVEIINADKIRLTGDKLNQKEYIWHSNHPGGLKRKKIREVIKENPAEVIRRAVAGMLPKNKLRDGALKRLKIK